MYVCVHTCELHMCGVLWCQLKDTNIAYSLTAHVQISQCMYHHVEFVKILASCTALGPLSMQRICEVMEAKCGRVGGVQPPAQAFNTKFYINL